MLLAVEDSATGLTSKKLCILRHDARRKVPAARQLRRGVISGYYHGTLLYEDLGSAGSRFKTESESIMQTTRRTFLKWASSLPETAIDRNMVWHPV